MTATAPAFSGEQLDELLALIKGSDSVELKLTIPHESQRVALRALGVDPIAAQIRQVFFFDTPDLALNRAGVVVRGRRIQGKGADTVVKLRPVVPADLPDELRRSASFRVEVDALPGGYVCSGTLKGAASPDDVLAVARGERPLRKLLSKEQRAYYAAHAPAGIELDDLTVLGPIFVLKTRIDPPDLGRRLVAEMWLYPDDSHVLELSTRTLTTDAFQAAAETRAFLARRGIDTTGEQETKTKKALEFFTKEQAPAIVPRWEWRTFGDDFGAAEATLSALEPSRAQESDEIYLLSSDGDASVKFRDGVMDVKELQQVDEHGLEQWRPVLKAPLPLSGRVRAAAVHKSRVHYLVGDCMAELSEITTPSGAIRTIAIEHPDPEVVLATVRELALEDRVNTSFARGLKELVGFGTQRFAVIDVGTNSVKLHVGEHHADGSWATVADRSEVTRLGDGLAEDGRLGAEPIRRTVDAIKDMAETAKRDGVAELVAVGTAGLRAAPNRDELIDAAREQAGVQVEVISGEEEARLAYRAATSALHLEGGSLVVFDSGGGSSQFTFGDGRDVEEQFSVDVGAIRFTERFGLDGIVSQDVLFEALEAIGAELTRLDGRVKPDAVIAMGGTSTNLAAVKHGLAQYDPDVVQGTVLDRAEIDRQIELYRTRTADDRRTVVGLQPKRAEIILAGACIVRAVLDKLGADAVTVSDRALRHGLIVERFG